MFDHAIFSRRWWIIFPSLVLAILLVAGGASRASAVAPNVVAGTAVVDGDPSEWDTSTGGPDFFIFGCVGQGGTTTGCLRPMDGSPTTAWYMRYDCHTLTLYVFVNALGANTIDTGSDQFIKGYPGGNDKVIDKTGTGLTTAFVYVPPAGTPKTGWEASGGPVPPGTYNFTLEAHTNGAQSSKSNDVTITLPPCPTADSLSDFSAKFVKHSVRVHWTTANELNLKGFNILRSNKRHGTYVKLNDERIDAASPGSVQGTNYKFKDKTAQPGKNFYKLEMVGYGGTHESDIVRVRVPKD